MSPRDGYAFHIQFARLESAVSIEAPESSRSYPRETPVHVEIGSALGLDFAGKAPLDCDALHKASLNSVDSFHASAPGVTCLPPSALTGSGWPIAEPPPRRESLYVRTEDNPSHRCDR